jgi:hypothetical protein
MIGIVIPVLAAVGKKEASGLLSANQAEIIGFAALAAQVIGAGIILYRKMFVKPSQVTSVLGVKVSEKI